NHCACGITRHRHPELTLSGAEAIAAAWAALSFMWTALALSLSLVSTTFGLDVSKKVRRLAKVPECSGPNARDGSCPVASKQAR
ncbi:MAG: hypothetical protein WBE53_11610, partial [Pseudolabrys sp.]